MIYVVLYLAQYFIVGQVNLAHYYMVKLAGQVTLAHYS